MLKTQDHRGHPPHVTHDIRHHHHGHHGATGNIKVAFFLNLAFTILEIFGGFFTNSVAILTDALHDLGDSLSLGLAWYLEKVAGKDRDRAYSYGYARFSVLGAFINSVVLIAGSVFILTETIPRLLAPEETHAPGMLVFAVVGILVNGLAVLRLRKGTTLNERAVALHLLEDVLGWVAILIGSIIMLFADVPILDPILSLAIMCYVLFNVLRNLGKSFRIFLQGTPAAVDFDVLQARLKAIPGVTDVHDLHLWTLDGQYNIATLHVAVRDLHSLEEMEAVKAQVRAILLEMDVEHVTIEVEDEDHACELQDC